MKKYKSLITSTLYILTLFSLALTCWFKSPTEYSFSERRVLNNFPDLNLKTVFSGEFMKDFEGYTTDQFPFRDFFKSLKANVTFNLFHQLDNHDIYVVNDYISKLEYPLNESMLNNASDKFKNLYDKYIKDTNSKVYFSIIPDKNYFMAKENGYLSMNYEELRDYMKENTSYMKYIDIFDKLELADYYRTDTHWKQESIVPIAQFLNQEMNSNYLKSYNEEIVWDKQANIALPFEGVYLGQSLLKIQPDEIRYLTNKIIDECKVYSYSTGKAQEIDMYNFEKAFGKDAYEMYLNGTEAIITIKNPNATTNKKLIMFRDSFGSSLAPLMVEGYSEITLVDIRYIDSDLIDNYIKFENHDVLFIYSTILLNNSSAFK